MVATAFAVASGFRANVTIGVGARLAVFFRDTLSAAVRGSLALISHALGRHTQDRLNLRVSLSPWAGTIICREFSAKFTRRNAHLTGLFSYLPY